MALPSSAITRNREFTQAGWWALQPPLPVLHVSRSGFIPKPHQPEKWRLILDLSSPAGHTVNDGIADEHFPLHYLDVDAITAGMRLGRGSLMAKLDVQMHTTFCQSIQRIAGCRVLNEVLPCMSIWSCPSGVRSAHIYSRTNGLVGQAKLRCHLPDALPWWLSPQHNLEMSIDCFSKLGIPLHSDKQEEPSTCLTILGIELDSLKVQARLPQDKFDRLTALLEEWSQRRWCKRKELESLIGHLQLHGCTPRLLFLAPNDQPTLRFSSQWPPNSSQYIRSSFLT